MLIGTLPIRAVIFDMDGVLFLSSDSHAIAYQQTLAEIGIQDYPYSKLSGMRTDEAFIKVFREHNQELESKQLRQLVKRKRDRAYEALSKFGQIEGYSKTLIARLRRRYRLALASSSSTKNVQLFLGRCGYHQSFELWLDGSSVKQAKPHPEIYLLASQRLGIEPESCLVVEDALNGVQAATSAGMRSIAVTERENSADFLRAGATHVVGNLKQVDAILLKQ